MMARKKKKKRFSGKLSFKWTNQWRWWWWTQPIRWTLPLIKQTKLLLFSWKSSMDRLMGKWKMLERKLSSKKFYVFSTLVGQFFPMLSTNQQTELELSSLLLLLLHQAHHDCADSCKNELGLLLLISTRPVSVWGFSHRASNDLTCPVRQNKYLRSAMMKMMLRSVSGPSSFVCIWPECDQVLIGHSLLDSLSGLLSSPESSLRATKN